MYILEKCNMGSKYRRGISLITLLITIVVIIILASAVIIAIGNNNPYSAANEAVFKSDLDSFRSELSEYHNTISIKQGRSYDQSSLQLSSQNIGDAINDLKNNSKYSGKLKVESGSLVFICTNTVEDKWAESIGIKTTCNDGDTGLLMYESNISPNPTTWTNQNVTLTISYPEKVVTKQYKVDSGEWTSYTEPFIIDKNSTVYARGFDSNSNSTNEVNKSITNIDKEAPSIALNGNSSVTMTAGATYTEQTAAASDDLSGINGSVAIAGNIDFNNPGTYTLQYTATDKAGNSSSVTRTVIVTAPSVPPSFVANPTSLTSGNVTVSITYSSYSSVKEYSYNTVNWTSYTQPLVISTNNTTIYARGKDNNGNIVGVSNLKITNIDKEAPTIPTVTYTSGANTCSWKNNYNLSLASTDNVEVAKYQFDYNDDGVVDYEITSGSFVPWNSFSTCTNRFRAVDTVGNVSGWTDYHHIHMDTEAPTHTSWWWGTATSSGVSLYIKVADNIGIQKVQCPTSTETGGYTNWVWFDAVWDATADAYRADITQSSFGHSGNYKTHLYIYDYAGNGGYYAESNIINIPPAYVTEYSYRDYTSYSCETCTTQPVCQYNVPCGATYDSNGNIIQNYCDQCYDSTSCTTGTCYGWGSWSAWSRTAVTSSSTRQVQTRQVPNT